MIIGSVDIAYTAWSIANSQSAHTTFSIFGLIAGFFLIRGSLKWAKWVSYFASFFVVASLGGLIASWIDFPISYHLATIRFGGMSGIYSTVMDVISIPLLIWICKELLSPEVLAAQRERNIKPARIIRPVIVGVIVSVVMGVILFKVNNSNSGTKAVKMAETKLGSGYQYTVTNIGLNTNIDSKTGKSETKVSAIVAAHNESSLQTVEVHWQE